ncbi:rhomboid family intramembrane serine protease [Xylanivirga thermophila]|uniref:rhomboid family intramembrane serine protease n=1 Tax=Xylanivirga thermophila TaxID=2496273 RepID=UPI00101DA67C|nr:rhomboid family intramembrane serine protease [Xylanivirga thermophila]
MYHRWDDNQDDRPDVIEGEYEVLDGDYKANDSGRGAYGNGPQFMLDKRPPYVTYTILGINIAMWLIMTITGLVTGMSQSEQLLLFGAKVDLLIAAGQYWRLFTAMFLHIGLAHLFFNSYALYIYGPVVESLFGKAKFLILYIISGLMGSLFSYMFSLYPAAGASGAIFGLMGALLYFKKVRPDIYKRVFGPTLFVIIAVNLIYGIIQPGIDNWGHIGGLIGGVLTANAIGLYKERFKKKQVIMWIIIIAIFIIGLRYGSLKYGRFIPPKKGFI